MTPEAASILTSLREDFYDLFQAKMKMPVKVSKGKSLIFNPSMAPIVSWIDLQERTNYLSIYAHTAPDQLIPQRPLLLRVAVNRWPTTSGQSGKGQKDPQGNQDWSWELTLLSEEMMAFAPWLARWIEADSRSVELRQRPPSILEFFPDLKANVAWSQRALEAMAGDQDLAA
ncbi:MAG: hypothetical protein ACFCU8_04995 [Thermosynechococcaceae cyanobacterium]